MDTMSLQIHHFFHIPFKKSLSLPHTLGARGPSGDPLGPSIFANDYISKGWLPGPQE